MNTHFCVLALLAFGAASCLGQQYVPGTAIYHQPTYTVPTHQGHIINAVPSVRYPSGTVVSSNPCSVCTQPSSNCDCNHGLQCTIHLPYNCKKKCETNTKPIHVKTLGTIPKKRYETSCYVQSIPFRGITEVPEIHCDTETCIKIGKKSYQCIPGCTFSLCVPTAECIEETVECKLVPKTMSMIAKIRKEGTIDVYVINNPDPNSPEHAGGMPEQWLVMHCASKTQVQAKYKIARGKDGKTAISLAKAPAKTDADVSIDIVAIAKKPADAAPLEAKTTAVNEDAKPNNESAAEAVTSQASTQDSTQPEEGEKQA